MRAEVDSLLLFPGLPLAERLTAESALAVLDLESATGADDLVRHLASLGIEPRHVVL